MSETFALADLPGAGADRPVEERGTLEVRARAIEQIIRGAALSVDGVVSHAVGGVQQLTGASYPSASVTLVGSAARAKLDVAVPWPSSVQDVATTVRDHVRAEATRLSGTELLRLDVTVHLVTTDPATPTRRRVQ